MVILQYTKERLQRFGADIRHLPRTLRLVVHAAKAQSIIWIIILLILGVLPIAVVYATRALVDSLVAATRIGSGWHAARVSLGFAALIGGLLILTELLQAVAAWVRIVLSEKIKDHVAELIHRKSLEVDLAFYDSSEFYDHLHRARSEASFRPALIVENLGALLQGSITVVAMFGVLLQFGLILPLALLVSTIPALYAVLHAAARRHRWGQTITSDERRTWYYDHLLTSAESAAEIRLFGLGDHFRQAYGALRTKLRGQLTDLVRQQQTGQFLASCSALLAGGSAMVWMIWRAINRAVSLGDLALFYQAFNQGLGLTRTLLENMGQLYENSLFLGNLYEFLDFAPQITDPNVAEVVAARLQHGIRFEGINFQYPHAKRPAVDQFDLFIPAGKLVALVGANGGGKSTIVKLLCRFYDPDAGRILLDEVPITNMPLQALRRRIAVLFQSPIHYNATAAANIWLGDIGKPSGECSEISNEVRHAAQIAGADSVITALPSGYETSLGRWFGKAIELSVGEWQRLSLARTFFRDADILILDEPTSAMDPWAEIEFAERMRDIVQNRIGIVITHRFTTAKFADVIHVMANGKIIETGSHDELLSLGGLYARGWAGESERSGSR